MKTMFYVTAVIAAVIAIWLMVSKKFTNSKFAHFYAGAFSLLALFFVTTTPLSNGQKFEIVNGKPVPFN